MIDMDTSYRVVKPLFHSLHGYDTAEPGKVKSVIVELSPGSTDPDYIDPSEGWPSDLNCRKIEKNRSPDCSAWCGNSGQDQQQEEGR